MPINIVIEQLKNKNILLLGFGREGKSSYDFIRKHLSNAPITIADKNPVTEKSIFNDPYTTLITGENYLDTLADYDIVIKSPGISLKNQLSTIDTSKISSQTDLFLQAFAPQCIGITGTKGKSTTTSLLSHILQYVGDDVLMAGNIGLPVFEIMGNIKSRTKIVLELSSHQLEFIHKSPHISILLNLFEEHLDHYRSFLDYQQAKFNIARYQSESDYFIYNTNDRLILDLLQNNLLSSNIVGFSSAENPLSASYIDDSYFCFSKNGQVDKFVKITDKFPLKGEHNLLNTVAVIAALQFMDIINLPKIEEAIYSFKGLPHRLEFVGKVNEIFFYNDSISTIPEATIAAINALKDVNTLILGGFDRGIDYQLLVDFMELSCVENLIFTGEAGKRMMHLFRDSKKKKLYFKTSYPEIVELAKQCTQKGKICLLSPAAASYDQFQNFEHRGNTFKNLVVS